MYRIAIAAFAFVVLAATIAAEEKANKPLGTWTREAGEAKITFAIKAEKLTVTIHTPNGELVTDASYEVTKDGELKGKLTKIEKNELGANLDEGHTFSFKYKIADGTMTISDLKGHDGNDAEEGPKNLVEGEYRKSKEKK
jgi:uncharacterized protein (DUF2147 family)